MVGTTLGPVAGQGLVMRRIPGDYIAELKSAAEWVLVISRTRMKRSAEAKWSNILIRSTNKSVARRLTAFQVSGVWKH